jgi:hypothetical protein
MTDQGTRVCKTAVRRRHVHGRLERVLWRYQPPHLVEAKPPQRLKAQMDVAVMGGIEGSAEQADAPRWRMADAEGGDAQGRT